MKTYSEQVAAIHFTAARLTFAVAASVLDDCTLEQEFTGQTARWAKNNAAATARKANELERIGHETAYATVRQQNDLYKAHRLYEAAIDRFESRARSFNVDPTTITA